MCRLRTELELQIANEKLFFFHKNYLIKSSFFCSFFGTLGLAQLEIKTLLIHSTKKNKMETIIIMKQLQLSCFKRHVASITNERSTSNNVTCLSVLMLSCKTANNFKCIKKFNIRLTFNNDFSPFLHRLSIHRRLKSEHNTSIIYCWGVKVFHFSAPFAGNSVKILTESQTFEGRAMFMNKIKKQFMARRREENGIFLQLVEGVVN